MRATTTRRWHGVAPSPWQTCAGPARHRQRISMCGGFGTHPQSRHAPDHSASTRHCARTVCGRSPHPGEDAPREGLALNPRLLRSKDPARFAERLILTKGSTCRRRGSGPIRAQPDVHPSRQAVIDREATVRNQHRGRAHLRAGENEVVNGIQPRGLARLEHMAHATEKARDRRHLQAGADEAPALVRKAPGHTVGPMLLRYCALLA